MAAETLIHPPALRPGDRIAAVSLSWGGPGTFPQRYAAGKRQLQAALDVEVVEMPHTLAEAGWLQRNPRARADDLLQAFQDPDIQGIFATIGGEDSIRLLPYLDLEVLRSHPKVFLGFSDTTVTHLACYTAGLTSFYGPSLMTGFAENGGMHAYTLQAVRQTLFSSTAPGRLETNTLGWTVEFLDWGNPAYQEQPRRLNPPMPWRCLQGNGLVRGRLFGGCLEVLDWLRGTPVWPALPEWQDTILFLETSEEAPPPTVVTRFLRCLAAQGILEKLAGVLFARPGGAHLHPEEYEAYDQALLTVLRHEQGLVDLPIVSRLDFGHTDPVFVLPYGVLAEINCQDGTLSLLEAGVRARP